MPVAFPNIPISQQSSKSTEYEMNTVRFGNGYEQRVPMGINYQRDKINVVWNALNLTNKNIVLAWLNELSTGTYTTWTSPFDTAQKKYVLDGAWSINAVAGNVYAINLTLRQVYDS